MSLINDALKKAQHDKATKEQSSNLPRLTPVVDRSKNRNLFFKYFFGALIAIALIICVTILLLSIIGKSNEDTKAVRTSDVEVSFESNKEASLEQSNKVLTQPTLSTPEIAPPNRFVGTDSNDDSLPLQLDSIKELANGSTDVSQPDKKEVFPEENGNNDLRAPSALLNQIVEQMVISGVRLSNSGSKVIINDKVYKILETVHRDPKLVITEITAQEVIFADINGNSYVKTY